MKYQKSTKKAQLQIMENAFVILIIFIILIIAFVFVVGMQRNEARSKAAELQELELVKKSRILNFLPELLCSDNNDKDPDCYDIMKIEAFRKRVQDNMFYYKPLLGNIKIRIVRFDPSPEVNKKISEWEIFDNPKPEDKGIREVQFPVLLKDILQDSSDYFGIVYIGVYE